MTLSRIENRGTLTGRLQRTSGGGGGVTDYGDLTGKPKINNVTVNGNKNGHDYGLANLSDIPVIPPSPPSYAMNSHDDDYTTADLEWIKSNDEEKQWKVYSSAFTSPTASSDGEKGLVPKALTGEQDKILSASGWVDPPAALKDYSTSEVDTGQKWIDGKHIYQKTYSLQQPSGAGNHIIESNATSFIDLIIDIKTIFYYTPNKSYQYNFYVNGSKAAYVAIEQNDLVFKVISESFSLYNLYCTIFYTKK